MKKFDIHVCTISDQATPNYVPILDTEFRPKTVILLVSKKMQSKAAAFKQVLKHFCNEVKVEQLDIENELDFTSVKDKLFNKISELNISTDKVGFNITGGTKLMAIETYLLAKNLDCQPFYFEQNKILDLRTADTDDAFVLPNPNARSIVPQNMKVEDYLALHGYQIKNNPTKKNELSPKVRQELLAKLMALSPMQRNAVTQFYGIISSNNSQQLKFSLADVKMHTALHDVIQLFVDYDVLTVEDNVLIFADEADKKFAHGGWFEEYVFNEVRKMEGIQDCLMNIEIIENDSKTDFKNTHSVKIEKKSGPQKKTKNEVDVAYMKDNALHVIECKSKNYDSKGNRSNNDIVGNGDLFKLETLQKLGGLYTKKIFVSYLPVPDFMKDRSEFARIQLIELGNNANLKTSLLK